MALTEEQEKHLLASHEALTKQLSELAPILSQVKPLTEKVSLLEKENGELKKGLQSSSQEQMFLSLKTKYPDVPESVLRATPEAQRETVFKELQDKLSTVKAASAAKTDPMKMWADAGGIGPTDEAEKAALEAEKRKSYDESAKRGDVHGMLKARSKELLGFIRQSFVGAKA